MGKKTYIFLKDLLAPVDLTECPEIVAELANILTFWPFEVRNENKNEIPPFFVARPYKKGYLVGSTHFDKPQYYPDPVNTICTLVAKLAWEQVRADPSLLCVHAAAVEFNGRLLLIPNKRRAGKSTLTAALAARGHRIFTDDFLPLAVNEHSQLCGVASGIAPRLRLPLPDRIGADSVDFVDLHSGPENRQYKYLKLGGDYLAHKGDMLPIGGIMVLNRGDDNSLCMSQPEKSDVLRVLITQNFARDMKSSGVLRSLEFLVSDAACFELSYVDVEQTLDLIEKTFEKWLSPPAIFDSKNNTEDFQIAELHQGSNNFISFSPNDPLQQSPGVTIRDLGTKKFLSDQNGHAIHQLNATSAAIWQLLNEPTSLSDITDIFQQAFPHNNIGDMSKDIHQTLRQMSKAGLVQSINGGPNG